MDKPSPAQMVADVQSAARAKSGGIRLSDWEEEFMENIERRVLQGEKLSEKQQDTLEHIWDKI